MTYLVRFFLIIAGLIFAASLMVVMLFLLALWGIRAIWCKLTGRPLVPFEMRMNPRAGFEQVFRRADRGAADDKPPRRRLDDVTDVEPKR